MIDIDHNIMIMISINDNGDSTANPIIIIMVKITAMIKSLIDDTTAIIIDTGITSSKSSFVATVIVIIMINL